MLKSWVLSCASYWPSWRLGALLQGLASPQADLHVVVTSPFFRCVQTAVLICKHFGRGSKLLIDNSLGEIYGPCLMGDIEPPKPVRPLSESLSFCSAHSVETLEVRRLLGKWPTWPESLKQARNRFGGRFVEYLKRGHRVKRNFVLVSHADCVGSVLTLIPGAGENIEKVHFGGHFIAFHPQKPLEVTSPTVTLSPLEQLDHAAVTAVRRLNKPEATVREHQRPKSRVSALLRREESLQAMWSKRQWAGGADEAAVSTSAYLYLQFTVMVSFLSKTICQSIYKCSKQ